MSTSLKIIRVSASSHSAHYVPENVLVDKPEDQASRWTGAYHIAGPVQRQKQWLKLELEDMCVVKIIKFGKFQSAHPCNTEQFKVYGSADETEDMIELLQSSLNNDDVPQSFALKHHNDDGVCFPCRFIKIVPLTPASQTYNMSIWHVSLYGLSDCDAVRKVHDDFVNYRETVTMRLILKHLRRRRYKAYQALLDETGLSIEHPLVSSLYEALVVQGDLARAEEIFISFATSGLLDVPSRARSVPTSSKKYARLSTIWRRIADTNADGGTPCARGGHASVIDAERGIIYIFGGWDGSQDLADFWAYSTSQQRWTTLSIDTSANGEGGPSARSCVAAAFDNRTGDIYFLGRYIPKPPLSQSYSQTSMAGNSGEEGISARTPGTAALPRVRRMRVSTGGGTPTSGTATVVYAAPRSPQESLTAFNVPSSSTPVSSTPGPTIVASEGPSVNTSPTSDFYRYSTRGPNEGKWELLSQDTANDGGPDLAHDLAMVMDSDAQTLYAFGGEVYAPGETNVRYGAMYSYNVQTGKWRKLFCDPAPGVQSASRHIPSREGHSMVFDSLSRKIYVIGGQRDDNSLSNIFTYTIPDGAISEMTMGERSPRPKAIQMLRATADEASREIYVIASLASPHRTNSLGEASVSQNQTMLWIYSMDENTWTPIIEPVHRNDVSWDNELGSQDGDPEPRPRLGHSVVLDSGGQTFYVFGGNSGEGRRLDDFWSLSLVRPGIEDILRKGKLNIRRQHFIEMCSSDSMLAAFQYLQSEISAVVDHQDEEESAAFRALLSFLLSRPPTPVEPPSIEKMDEDAVMGEADVNMGDATVVEEEPSSVSKSFTNGHNHDPHRENTHEEGRAAGVVMTLTTEGGGRRSIDGDERHRQRTDVFERLLTFVDPSVKQPRADLVDLIRVGMIRDSR